jgi:sugar phosphate isomerase/epimerase
MLKQCLNWPVSVCTWSMQNDLDCIDALMKNAGIGHVHLDLRPVCIDGVKDFLQNVRRRNWSVSAAMIGFPQEDYTTLDTIRTTGGIVPEDCWPKNQDCFLNAIDTAAQLGVAFLSAHIGFIDHTKKDEYKKLLGRIRSLADAAAQKKVMILMETGQETAAELKHCLTDLNHPAVGINFDPANMILYGKGNPIEAVRILAPWIRHVHIKDAIASQTPGQWGSEVVWGTGQVDPDAFLTALKDIGYKGALAIEREAGQTRQEDIRLAIDRLIRLH